MPKGYCKDCKFFSCTTGKCPFHPGIRVSHDDYCEKFIKNTPSKPIFDITNENNVREFDEIDPFNEENKVKGFIHKSGKSTYGALYITHVNGKECPQNVYCTPKMEYPFDRFGVYRQDLEDRTVYATEKIDGTNILAYRYFDADGKEFVTYKTRLRPFLGKGQFGDFKSLWDEMLIKYPFIKNTVHYMHQNISFELFGKRNKILIDYDVSLDVRTLFFIDAEGRIACVSGFKDYLSNQEGFPPVVRNLTSMANDGKKFMERYNNLISELEKALIVIKVPDGEGGEKVESMSGIEGSVIYVYQPGKSHWEQLKAKPSAVFDIHTAEKGIPYHSIYTTIMNAFEEGIPTIEKITELLLEEFDESDVAKRKFTIRNILKEILFTKELTEKIKEDYVNNNFDINADKTTCMRFFGKNYDKSLAGKIYGLLKNEYGVSRSDEDK